jgi:hypothetical protein
VALGGGVVLLFGEMDATQTDTSRRAGPYLLAPGEVRRGLPSWPGATLGVKADSGDTAGLLAVLEGTLAPWAPGPPAAPAHPRRRNAVRAGGHHAGADRRGAPRAGRRGLRVDPAGHPHTFANAAGTPLRGLTLAVPGGLEGLLADLGDYLGQLRDAPDPAELGRIGAATAAACSARPSPPAAPWPPLTADRTW